MNVMTLADPPPVTVTGLLEIDDRAMIMMMKCDGESFNAISSNREKLPFFKVLNCTKNMMDDFSTIIEHLALIEPFSKTLSVKCLII